MIAQTSLGLIAETILWCVLVMWLVRATLATYKAIQSESSVFATMVYLGVFFGVFAVLGFWLWAFYALRGLVAVRGPGFEIVVPLLLIGLWVRSVLPRPKKWGFLGFSSRSAV